MLKINKSLSSFDIRDIDNPVKRAKVLILGTIISVNLYSGATFEESYSETKDSYTIEKSIVDIPNYYKKQIAKECGISIDSIDYSILENIDSLTLKAKKDYSLEFLSNCSNLKNLCLSFKKNNDYVLDTIPEINSLENLTIKANENLEISEKVNSLVFEKNKNNLKNLCLDGVIVGPNVIENLSSLDSLTLVTSLNYDFDYSKLKVNTLDISSYGKYDVPIFLSRTNYNYLVNNNVDIVFNGGEEGYLQILDRLDNIIESFDIENKSEREQMNCIMCYVLDNLKYDEDVFNALDNDEDVSSLIINKGFYDEGNLKGALENDTQICGNYAALCKALLNEIGINSFYTLSETHAWNLVEIEKELYYIDLTYLDTFEKGASKDIQNGEVLGLNWYMERPEDVRFIDTSDDHKPILFPEYFENYSINNDDIDKDSDEVIKGDNKEVSVKVNDRNYKVPLAVLVGILSALGIAIPIRRKRKKVKRIANKEESFENIIGFSNIKEHKINFNNDYNYYDYKFKGRKK